MIEFSVRSPNDEFMPVWGAVGQIIARTRVVLRPDSLYSELTTMKSSQDATLFTISNCTCGELKHSGPWVIILAHASIVYSCTNEWYCSAVWTSFHPSLIDCLNDLYDVPTIATGTTMFITPGSRSGDVGIAKREAINIFENKAVNSSRSKKLVISSHVRSEMF